MHQIGCLRAYEASCRRALPTQVLKLSALPRSFGGGTFAYAIRPRGARKLLERAFRPGGIGVTQPIDWFILQRIGTDFSVRGGRDPNTTC